MNNWIFIGYCFLWSLSANVLLAQNDKPTRYSLHCVHFKDKACKDYSLLHPQAFLSPRALERRAIQSIAIEPQDIPVCEQYCAQLIQLGAALKGRSKWLNAVAVHTQDAQLLNRIAALPFVQKVKALGFHRKAKKAKMYTKRPPLDSSQHHSNYYGLGARQLQQHKGQYLHELGFRGKGIQVAVIDAGFSNAYRMAVFDSVYLQDRLLGMRDFVEGDTFVYESSAHGNSVWSVMAANLPHLLVGTAPDASYYLFKAEDVRGEYPAEEFYWLLAAEYADSVGADVINSSMGYHNFRNPTFSYKKEDLDGQTTLISRAATWASAKGLLIVNAAGNDGHKAWRTLSAPADVSEVLTVAASTPEGTHGSFSSVGPTADQRLKPDVAALGTATAYASMIRYEVGLGEGTSYACPVIAGLTAALKQAFPTVPNRKLRQAIRESGHQAQHPDTLLGYGLPNFWEAFKNLADSSIFINSQGNIDQKYRLVNQQLHVYVEHKNSEATNILLKLRVTNLQGQLCGEKEAWLQADQINKISLVGLGSCGKGVFVLRLEYAGTVHWLRLLR